MGGVVWDKQSKSIQLDATILYPEGMPLELVLCNDKGRKHETLFVTKTRPLHLEVMLHLAGFEKNQLFKIFVKNKVKEVPIEDFMSWKAKSKGSLLWKFNGSEFGENYIPDSAGEQIIIWSRNEGVMQVNRKDFTNLKTAVHANELKDFPNKSKVKIIIKRYVK